MGRPFTATDEDILNAAGKVIARRGAEGFSIAEVAADVGLSRAAIIFRFKSMQVLRVASLKHLVDQFARAIKVVPRTPSGDNLLRLAGFIGGYIHDRDSLSSFFSTYSTNVQDPDLLALESRRGEILRSAVADVMPRVSIAHSAAVTAFCAQLTGSILAWLATNEGDPRRYLVLRARDWVELAGIAYNPALLKELLQKTPSDLQSAAAKCRTASRSAKGAK